MSLISKIQNDLLSERKAGTNKLKISLLTTLYSEASIIGFNDKKRETTDVETIAVIKKFIKNIDECLTHAANQESYLVEKEILSEYLPKQMNEAELKTAIDVYICGCGDVNKSQIMKYLKSSFNGRYDGKLAAQVVDSIL